MILPLEGKWKIIFLKKKIHENMIFSLNVLKRWSSQKGSSWDMIFFVLSGKVVFFSRKHGIFSRTENERESEREREREREDFPQEIHGNMVFSIWYVPRPPVKKKIKDDPIPQKVTDTLDWHPRKNCSNSLFCFMETFTAVFIYCSPGKIRQET